MFRDCSTVLAGVFVPGDKHVRLVLIGGSRNADDAARLEGLKSLARELGIAVRFPSVV